MKHFSFHKRELQFNFNARTSRGEIKTHSSYLLQVQEIKNGNVQYGYGEAAPLSGLSPDSTPEFENQISQNLQLLNEGIKFQELDLSKLPALKFGIETALRDLLNGGERKLYNTSFLSGEPIAINGLVWMDTPEPMLKQALEKVTQGFNCIKFKIGAHDFDAECRMLESFRKLHPEVEIRLDANGAFFNDEALEKLRELNRFIIHSIEQPVKPGQPEFMQEICIKSPVPVALDEELIGVDPFSEGFKLLQTIRPAYLILKPTLTGGIANSEEWIRIAQKWNINWWATSALESSVGLNAIAQWVSSLKNPLPQGLGTGALYANNIPSPLEVKNGKLFYFADKKWELPLSTYE